MRAAFYARVSTHDQQTLSMQLDAMTAYISDRGWKMVRQVEDVGSGAKDRPGRESLLKAARRREVDVIAVWRLDRWGRSVADLMTTLRELTEGCASRFWQAVPFGGRTGEIGSTPHRRQP